VAAFVADLEKITDCSSSSSSSSSSSFFIPAQVVSVPAVVIDYKRVPERNSSEIVHVSSICGNNVNNFGNSYYVMEKDGDSCHLKLLILLLSS